MTMDILTLMDRYGDDRACREALEHLRWPNGIACPALRLLGRQRCQGQGDLPLQRLCL